MNAEFGTQAQYDAYLETLSPASQMISQAYTCAVDLSIAFGLTDEDRGLFDEHSQKIIDMVHEGYVAGHWRPGRGSFAEYLISIAEAYAGGRPRPEHRKAVSELVARSLMATIKNGATQRRSPLVPLNDQDPKRRKALDDLDRLEDA